MKSVRRMLLLAALLTLSSFVGCVPTVDPAASSWPAGESATIRLDDGVSAPGGVRTVRFQLDARQSGQLIDTTTSCNCTAIRTQGQAIRVGEPFVGEAEIKVSDKAGDFSVKILFKTVPAMALPPLEITYHSRSGLYVLPADFDLGQVVEARPVERALRIENWDSEEIEDLQAEFEGVEHAEAEIFSDQPTDYPWGRPLQSWLASIRFTPPAQGAHDESQNCVIRLQDPVRQSLAVVPIRFEVSRAVRLSPNILHFGSIPARERVTRTGYVVFNRELTFASAPQFHVEVVDGVEFELDTSNPRLVQVKAVIEGDGSGSHFDRVVQIRVSEPAPCELSLRIVGENLPLAGVTK